MVVANMGRLLTGPISPKLAPDGAAARGETTIAINEMIPTQSPTATRREFMDNPIPPAPGIAHGLFKPFSELDIVGFRKTKLRMLLSEAKRLSDLGRMRAQ